MPKAPIYNGNSNPNAKGGAFGYDGRTGLGIGSLGGDPNSGIGRNWNMGDALSSPKGEYDYDEYEEKAVRIASNTTVRDLAIFAGLIDSEEDYDELEAGIEAKSHSSFHRGATDSLAHRGRDISSLGGLGNSMAGVIGLSAGKVIGGNIMIEDCIKQYIKEIILLEKRNGHMSGSIQVRSGGKGSMYKNAMASTNTADASSSRLNLPKGRHGISRGGYGQKSVKVSIKGASSDVELNMTPNTDGVDSMNLKKALKRQEEAEDSFNDGNSTYQDLKNGSSKEARDQENVDFHSRF